MRWSPGWAGRTVALVGSHPADDPGHGAPGEGGPGEGGPGHGGPGHDVPARLQRALAGARKSRDQAAVAALRSALSAISNAEAVPLTASGPAAASSPHVAGAGAGLGAGEAARRSLSPADIDDIVRAEVDERERAALGYARAGRAERADRLRREAEALKSVWQRPPGQD